MHTAPIGQIRADARFERLVTASNDKTLRLWRLADLQLMRTVYLPSEAGPEGIPHSVAMSADGLRVYAAGVTGWQFRGASHIYVVDAEAGRIVGAIGRFEGDVVTALDLSPDGKRLAVGLGRGGLAVIDASSGVRLHADPQYAAPVTFVHHAPDGRLATSSDDGCMRVYAANGTLLHRNQYPPIPADKPQCTGGELGGVRFSPDGRWLALGTQFKKDGRTPLAEVPVFDGQTLQLRRIVRATDADQRSLCCIAWSPDSHTLFVNGSVEGDQPTPLYRIRGPATGAMERWNLGRQQITNMLPMPDGSVVFATTVPSLTRVEGDGRPATRLGGRPLSTEAHNIDFHRTRNSTDRFLVAADGRSIAFESAPGHWIHANPLHLDPNAVLALGSASVPGLKGAMHVGATTVVTGTGQFSYRDPTLVNGLPVRLNFEEGVKSWAVHPRLAVAALGTQWRLHLLNDRGEPMPGWEDPPFLAAPAYHTVISEDGRWVLVATGDGTVRWYEVASGRQRLGLFIHANSSDWVAWRPDGHYASSPNGDQYVGWLVNRDDNASPDFFRAVQFERQLYRPDLLRAALDQTSNANGTTGLLAQTLRQLAAPRVAIESIQPGPDPGTLAIRFTAEATGRRINEVGVYIDGLPVLRAAERVVQGAEGERLTRTVLAPAIASLAAVRVEAETAVSLGLDESVPLAALPTTSLRRGRLWLLAVGVHRFDKLPGVRPLPSTTNDARELSVAFAAQGGRAFSELRTTVLTEQTADKPTKANLLTQLDALKQVQPEDTVVVFLASHGVTDAAEYYFITKDATPVDVEKVLAAQSKGTRLAEGAVPSLLTGTELMQALRRVPGRRILMLDTCHADAAARGSDPYALLKRSASTQVAVVSAARGDELSHDSPDAKHGAFTLAMIDALNGKASPAQGPMTLRAAFDAATPRLQEILKLLQAKTRSLAERAGIRQTPVLTAPPALESSVLAVH